MRFVSAVALAAVMLWVPVDGVAQTQAEREMLQLYESRERQLLASMDPAADQAERDAYMSACVARAISGSGGRRGGIGAGMAECTDRMRELGNQQAARRRPLEQELFALRQDKVELERRIRLTRASPPPPPQPEVRGPPVTASAGATVVCSMSAEELGSLRSYAEQGDAVAQAELGSVYGNGNCVPQDYVTAVRWSRSAADQGNARAQSSLGYAYQNGFGVPEDYVEAVRLYRLAADQGNALAQSNLGLMYAQGFGVPEDIVLAYMWFNIAAAQGNEGARNNKDFAEQQMTREQITEAQRLTREWLEAHPPGGN